MQYSSTLRLRRLVLCLIGVMSCAQFIAGFTLILRQSPQEIGLAAAAHIESDSNLAHATPQDPQKHAALAKAGDTP